MRNERKNEARTKTPVKVEEKGYQAITGKFKIYATLKKLFSDSFFESWGLPRRHLTDIENTNLLYVELKKNC